MSGESLGMLAQHLPSHASITIDTAQRVLDDPNVASVAKELGIAPAQALISWAIQRNTVVLPKSVTPERIASNLEGKRIL